MYKYSRQSQANLATCCEELQTVFNRVILYVDNSIIEGHRTLEQQQDYFAANKSHLDGINQLSKHQSYPSLAVDVTPYPVDWEDAFRFTLFAGVVLGIARSEGIILRWGGDWDGDWTNRDQKFHDMPHFEFVRELSGHEQPGW